MPSILENWHHQKSCPWMYRKLSLGYCDPEENLKRVMILSKFGCWSKGLEANCGSGLMFLSLRPPFNFLAPPWEGVPHSSSMSLTNYV